MRMPDKKLVKLSLANARSVAAEWAYVNHGVDRTRPIQIYGGVNYACNARCRMCAIWREERKELPASVWNRFLSRLKDLSGMYNVNFSGGETLLKQDLFEILDHCRRLGVISGITTNGLLLDGDRVERLLECDVFNVNISLDSVDEAVHDHLRGVPGMCARVKRNVELLSERNRATGHRARVVLKPLVCNTNLGGLPDIVRFTKDLGLTGINFQPLTEQTEEAKDLVITDMGRLTEMMDELIRMKKAGYPIMNSDSSLRNFVDHFKSCVPANRQPCVVGLRNLFVNVEGKMRPCHRSGLSIGNITTDDVYTAWTSEHGRKVRRDLVNCTRFCMGTCMVRRRPMDYVRLAGLYLGR